MAWGDTARRPASGVAACLTTNTQATTSTTNAQAARKKDQAERVWRASTSIRRTPPTMFSSRRTRSLAGR